MSMDMAFAVWFSVVLINFWVILLVLIFLLSRMRVARMAQMQTVKIAHNDPYVVPYNNKRATAELPRIADNFEATRPKHTTNPEQVVFAIEIEEGAKITPNRELQSILKHRAKSR